MSARLYSSLPIPISQRTTPWKPCESDFETYQSPDPVSKVTISAKLSPLFSLARNWSVVLVPWPSAHAKGARNPVPVDMPLSQCPLLGKKKASSDLLLPSRSPTNRLPLVRPCPEAHGPAPGVPVPAVLVTATLHEPLLLNQQPMSAFPSPEKSDTNWSVLPAQWPWIHSCGLWKPLPSEKETRQSPVLVSNDIISAYWSLLTLAMNCLVVFGAWAIAHGISGWKPLPSE